MKHLLNTEVWDRRPIDIVAEFAENRQQLRIRESRIKVQVGSFIHNATESEHLFRKVNFDLFSRLVMDHGHMANSFVTRLETLQKVALRAKSESLDMQLMVAGLLSLAKER